MTSKGKGIASIIFTFTVMGIVIGLSIYTAWHIAYGQEWNTTALLGQQDNQSERFQIIMK